MFPENIYNLEEILNKKQIDCILNSSLGVGGWQILSCDIRPAADGIAGFLGDHLKLALHLQSNEELKTVNLFVKRLPVGNKPKTDFIDDGNYFRREMLIYKLSEQYKWSEGDQPWGVKAYLYTDSLLVLPDISVQGYTSAKLLDTFDLPHLILTVTAVARYHADFANFETKKKFNGKTYTVLQENEHILSEPIYKDSPWVHASAKLTTNFVKEFSAKYYNSFVDMDNVLVKLYIEACTSLKDYKNTLNVLIHKDLWVNNIMFKYEDGKPANALILDFQCIRYGPPAFDLMILLYLTTSRQFREKHEAEILCYYYKTFCKYLEEETRVKLKGMGYNKKDFLCWCERSRMFGMFEAIGILPYVLMDPHTAKKTFDDPETYDKFTLEDRSEPVITYSNKVKEYKDRNLEVIEEFIERYVLKQIN